MNVREKLVEIVCDAMERDGCIGHCNNSPCFEVERVVNALIANGVTVQEWIPASELPKDTYEYWIAYKAGGDYSYSTGYFDGKYWRSALTHHKIPVTNWMPISQPPKGE